MNKTSAPPSLLRDTVQTVIGSSSSYKCNLKSAHGHEEASEEVKVSASRTEDRSGLAHWERDVMAKSNGNAF